MDQMGMNSISNEQEFCDQMMDPIYVKVVFTYIYFH